MSEKQYRVVADRDKGDKMPTRTEIGDRITQIVGEERNELVRIERPVPTEHCLSTAHHDGHEWAAHEGQPGTGYWCPGFDAAEEHPLPTTGLPKPMRLADAEADSFHEAMHAPPPSTREQIAEGYALIDAAHESMAKIGEGDWTPQDHLLLRMTNTFHAVLALIGGSADA